MVHGDDGTTLLSRLEWRVDMFVVPLLCCDALEIAFDLAVPRVSAHILHVLRVFTLLLNAASAATAGR